MNTLYSEQQLITQILNLLRQTDLYEDQHSKMVDAAFDSSWYGDLVPHVKVEPNVYHLQMYERGIQILDKKTKAAEDVIYWVLEDLIQSIGYIFLLQKYEVDNIHNHLKLTPEVQAEWTEIINCAFRQIGGIYEQWHAAGRRNELGK